MLGDIELFRAVWWTVLLRGLFGIAFGAIALFWPGVTLLMLIAAFGVYALADGIIALLSAVWPRQGHLHRGPLALEGVVSLIAGILTFRWPAITAFALVMVIAAWAMISGMFKLDRAFSRYEASGNRWLLGLSGALLVVLSIVLLGAPVRGAMTLVSTIGIFALVTGALLFALSFTLRRRLVAVEEEVRRAA
jgi:uncharacterized membrane protein HdeD (DUF308 family)